MVRNMMVKYFSQPILLILEPILTVFDAVVQEGDVRLIILSFLGLSHLIINLFSEFQLKLLLHFNGLIGNIESVMLIYIVIVSQAVTLENFPAHFAPVPRSVHLDMLQIVPLAQLLHKLLIFFALSVQRPHLLFVFGGLFVLLELLLERVTALAMRALELLLDRLSKFWFAGRMFFGFLEAVRLLIEQTMTQIIEISRLEHF